MDTVETVAARDQRRITRRSLLRGKRWLRTPTLRRRTTSLGRRIDDNGEREQRGSGRKDNGGTHPNTSGRPYSAHRRRGATSSASRDDKSFLFAASPADARIDPLQDQIGDLQVVFVLHDHVAVAANAALWRREHLGLTAGILDTADHRLTALEARLPGGERGQASRGVAIIAKDHENRERRQRLDLLVGVVRRAATRFDEDEPFGDRWIQQRRGEGKRSRLRVPHQHRTIYLTGEIRQRLERGVRNRHAAKTH